MQDMTASTWLRRGSSVVFHQDLLGPLISAGCLVSLREALGWMKAWPANPPGNGQTVLVGGLEAALEVMSTVDAEKFLRSQMRGLIHRFQEYWSETGLVFGFGCSGRRFEVDPFENIMFTVPGQEKMNLSVGLWNGAAKERVFRITVQSAEGPEPGGFNVGRS